jgi:SAM-dependent methyltransferase
MKVSEKDVRRLYGDLAWTWPIISPPEEYVRESEFFAKVIREHSELEPRALLHLGCGGGHNDYTLKQHFKVTGVDISPVMLNVARTLNPDVTYIEGDMRTARLKRTFGAVAILDSVNYMLTESDLRAAFETAFAHLKPGGVFVTIIEQTLESFRQNKIHYLIRERDGVEIAFIENMYDPDPTDTSYESTFIYLIRRGGRIEIESDRHLGGLFPVDIWYDTLNSVGFTVKTVEYEDPESGDDIPVVVCTKEGKGSGRRMTLYEA